MLFRFPGYRQTPRVKRSINSSRPRRNVNFFACSLTDFEIGDFGKVENKDKSPSILQSHQSSLAGE